MDLPVWQQLYSELKDNNFVVLAVAMDSREGAELPWIEAAKPEYPCLIDREHRLADIYNMVNVPQAIWIDEQGRVVRPVETAGSYEGFRAMDRSKGTMPEDVAKVTADAKKTYIAAVRDWVLKGPQSEHAFDEQHARAHVEAPDSKRAEAHVLFRLGQALLKRGRADDAEKVFARARDLHPDSWNIWRQTYPPNERGLAAGPEFWARVDALGKRRYYAPVDMKGMPG
jgi:TolA-binding protein